MKAIVGLGEFENSQGILEDGQAVSLGLGYGINNKFHCLVLVDGFRTPGANNVITEFDAGEISLQYKFMPGSRHQPYGKIGIGGYQLKDRGSDEKMRGGGFNFAVGSDYFFSKHFGLGAELIFKNIECSCRSRQVADGELITDIDPSIDGQSFGFLITFTIQ